MKRKSIRLTEEAYRRLKLHKRPGETFSDVIVRLTSNARDLKDLFGSLSKEEADRLEARMKENRERWKASEGQAGSTSRDVGANGE